MLNTIFPLAKWLGSRFIFLSLVFLTCISSINAEETKIVSRRAFFPLSSPLANALIAKFDLTKEDLPSGLYYSSVSFGRSRVDVTEKRMLDRKYVFDASYLYTDSHLRKLYQEDRWVENKPTNFKKVNGDWKRAPFDETKFVAGWIRSERSDGVFSDQLWIVAPNGNRWLLLEKGDFGTRKKFFSALPEHFEPVADGALVFSKAPRNAPEEGWKLNLLFVGGSSKTSFSYRDFEGINGFSDFRVALHGPRGSERPLVFVGKTEKVIFAGWPLSEKTSNATLQLRQGSPVHLYSLDLQTGHIEEMMRLRWPFWILGDTLFMDAPLKKPAELDRRAIDWEAQSIGPLLSPVRLDPKWRTSFSKDGFFVYDRNDKKYSLTHSGQPSYLASYNSKKLSKDEYHRVEMLGVPQDLINNSRIGRNNTSIHLPKLEKELDNALSGMGNKSTAVVLVYREGEPIDLLLESFFWSVDQKVQSFSKRLETLQHAFSFGNEEFHWTATKRTPSTLNLSSALSEMTSLFRDRSILVHLKDYPVKDLDPGNTKSVEGALGKLEQLKGNVLKAARSKQIPLLITLPENVYNTLKNDESLPFESFQVVYVQKQLSDYAQRKSFARSVLLSLVVNEELNLTADGFDEAFEISEVDREAYLNDGGSDYSFYMRFFNQLVSFSKNELSTQKDITKSLVASFNKTRTKEYGNWRIVTRPMGDNLEIGPQWFDPRTNESLPVLTDNYLSQWELSGFVNSRKLVSEDLYSHAIFIGQGPDLQAQLILLRPRHKMHVLLENRKVEYIKLHPRGFYAIVRDQDELKLIFFKIDFKQDAKSELAPGEQINLARMLDEVIISEPDRIQYRLGQLWVRDSSGLRAFSPEREISISTKGDE